MLNLIEITSNILTRAVCAKIYKWRFIDYIDNFKSPFVPRFDEHVEFMMREISNPMISWFILEDQIKVVGCFSIEVLSKSKENKTCTLGRVMIDPDRRGQGLGETLLKKGIDHIITNKNIERIQLEVIDSNIAAINLYKKSGFIVNAKDQNMLYMELNV